jgi:hypothetical protein
LEIFVAEDLTSSDNDFLLIATGRLSQTPQDLRDIASAEFGKGFHAELAFAVHIRIK